MHIVLRNIKLKKTKYGHDIVIKMVREFEGDKFVKNHKINEDTIELIKSGKITFKRKRI